VTSIRHDRVTISRLELPDLAQLAAVHRRAFPDSALSRLGHEAVRRYYEWQLTGPHDSVALGGFVDGELGGFCVGGVFRNKMSGYLRRNCWFLITRIVRSPQLLVEPGFHNRMIAGLRIIGVLPKTANRAALYADSNPQSFGILAIGVDPRCQGLGLGRQLMAEAESLARRRGFQWMNLSVKATNEQAIRFYESLDWRRSPGADAAWQGEMIKCLSD
jgi:ribosomal protein S18 acetylase RimI-like enzyme